MKNPIFMPNGWAVYPKRGEPPPDMEGYRRKGKNPKTVDAFIFIPIWQDCTFRTRGLVPSNTACKCPRIVTKCNHPESPSYHQSLTLKTCENCQLRNVHKHEGLVELRPRECVSESVVVIEQGDSQPFAERAEADLIKRDGGAPEDSAVVESQGEQHSVSRVWMEELVEGFQPKPMLQEPSLESPIVSEWDEGLSER